MKKLLFLSDLHERMKDLTTIKGYCNANRAVQADIKDFCISENIDIIIEAGDLFDGGYGSDVGAALAHADAIMELAKVVHGEFYGVIGNHIRVRMDSNPELYLIQPHDVYKSRWETDRVEQIIKTPRTFMVNGVQISLCHFNPLADSAISYATPRDLSAKYHVGVYHSEKVIPKELLSKYNPYMTSSYSDVARALEGVDYAFVGHIHKPLGMCDVMHEDGSVTKVYVPGSLANTEVSEVSMHDFVDLPVLTITDDGIVSWSYHKFSLHTEMCDFHKKGSKTEEDEKLKALRFGSKSRLYEDMVGQTVLEEDQIYMSLNMFLKENNYTEMDRNLIRSTIHNPEDIDTLVSIHKSSKEASEV